MARPNARRTKRSAESSVRLIQGQKLDTRRLVQVLKSERNPAQSMKEDVYRA
jgi:hypothetical protein